VCDDAVRMSAIRATVTFVRGLVNISECLSVCGEVSECMPRVHSRNRVSEAVTRGWASLIPKVSRRHLVFAVLRKS
jgi:hypothetical protein